MAPALGFKVVCGAGWGARFCGLLHRSAGGGGTPCEQLSPTQGGAGVVVGGGAVGGPGVAGGPAVTGPPPPVHELGQGSVLAGSAIPKLQS